MLNLIELWVAFWEVTLGWHSVLLAPVNDKCAFWLGFHIYIFWHPQNFWSWTYNLVSNYVRDSCGPHVAHVKAELCLKNFTISKWALKKTEKYIGFYSLGLEAIFLSLTLVSSSQQSLICPGLLSDTDLSFVMICSNTRPLTFSLYISASPHPLEEKTHLSFDCETQSTPASFGI